MSQTSESRQLEELRRSVFAVAAAERSPMIGRMRQLVEIESPSHDKMAVNRAVECVASWCAIAGGTVKRHPQRDVGDSLEVRFGPASSDRKPILLLGHLDTVWEVGTLATMPWVEDDQTIRGPGALDMKSGVVMGLTAVGILTERKLLQRPIVFLLNADEEIGSPGSRGLTENLASQCDSVYVLEPAQGVNGAYKTARKGVAHYRIEISGVSAHAGVDFQNGHSAVVELAKHIVSISQLNGRIDGSTINVGLIGGGTCSNVVPASAWADIDVRVASMKDAESIDRTLRSLTQFDSCCDIRIVGELNRPPMLRTKGTAELFRRARKIAAQMGIENLHEASTGGGSDGNFTSALGIPTLDGMGAVGAGAHADHEHVLKAHLGPRTALLAGMIL